MQRLLARIVTLGERAAEGSSSAFTKLAHALVTSARDRETGFLYSEARVRTAVLHTLVDVLKKRQIPLTSDQRALLHSVLEGITLEHPGDGAFRDALIRVRGLLEAPPTQTVSPVVPPAPPPPTKRPESSDVIDRGAELRELLERELQGCLESALAVAGGGRELHRRVFGNLIDVDLPETLVRIGGQVAKKVVEVPAYGSALAEGLLAFLRQRLPAEGRQPLITRIGWLFKGWGDQGLFREIISEIGNRRYGQGRKGEPTEVAVLLRAQGPSFDLFPEVRDAVLGVAFSRSWPDLDAFRVLGRMRASGRPTTESIDDVIVALGLLGDHAQETAISEELAILAFNRRKDYRERLAAARGLARVDPSHFAQGFFEAMRGEDSRNRGVAAATLFVPRPQVDQLILNGTPDELKANLKAILERSEEMEARMLAFVEALDPHMRHVGVKKTTSEGIALNSVFDMVRWVANRMEQDRKVRNLAQVYLKLQTLINPKKPRSS